jgi:hypothetical protein
MAATPVALEITTTSETMNAPPWPTPNLPKITMNGNPFPQPDPGSIPSGFQLVILDQTKDITSPSSILVNECHPLPAYDNAWETYYQYMYANLVTQLLTTGDPQYQLVFAVSYGMDQNASPTNEAIEAFLSLGAGAQLQSWVLTADPGSGGGDSWVSIPMSYILVGTAGASYGEGSEIFEDYSSDSGTTSLSVTLENGS